MKHRVLLAAIWAASTVLCGTGVVYADQTYTFFAMNDAWVNEANPTANYGNNTYMSVKDRSGLAEAYLRFDQGELNALAGKPITSASLFLYQYQGTNSPGDTLNAHNIGTDWSETTVSWDNRPSYDAVPAGSLVLAGDANVTGWREWSGLGNTVEGWSGTTQFGLAIENNRDIQEEELYARFYASEYSNAAFRPYLKVTAAPEPVSMLLFSLGGGILCCRRFR